MKKKSKLSKILVILSALATLSSCSKVVEGFKFPEYSIPENQNNQKVNLDKDEGMDIDGVLDEKEWMIAKKNSYTVVNSASPDVKLESMCYIGEKGVYFGVIVDDYAVYYNEERRPSRNTSVEVHFKGFGNLDTKAHCIRIIPTGDGVKVDYKDSSWRLNLNGLGKMQWMTSPFTWEGASYVKGNMNTSSCEGYVCEAFVPWDVLGVENHKYIRTYTAFNHVESASLDGDRIWAGTQGSLLTKPNTWKIVSNQGMVQYDDIINDLVVEDETMSIDGKLDEPIWAEVQDANFVYKTAFGKEVKLSASSYMTDKGAYFGFVVKDNYVYYADETVRPIGLNSGMEILFAPYGVTEITPECLQLRITANNVKVGYSGVIGESYPWSFDQFDMLTGTTIQDNNGLGGLNSNKNEGYTIEIFIPWTSFGSNTKLDGVMVLPNVIHAENESQSQKAAPWDYCNVTNANVAGQTNPQEHYIFMENDGAVLRKMDTPNVFFTSNMLNQETGYYEYEFEVEASFVTLNEKSSSDKYLVNPTFETPENLIIENINNGKFRAKVKKEEIEKFKDGIEFDTICNGKKEKSRAYFSEICVDGNPNDEKYGRSYKTLTNVSENIISQEVSTYFGEKGIFVGYDVKDAIIRNKTHVETIFTLGKEIAVGNTYQIRCYPHSNTSKTYIYQTPASDGWAWLERTGDYKLDIIADTNLTSDGYQVEIFIPYSTFGLEKAPEELYILPCVSYYKDKNTLVTSQYHNQTGVSNYYTHDRSKFVTFDEKGYVTNSVSVEDIYLTDAQIIDGNYVADLICKDDQNNDYGIKEIKSHSNYFVKKSEGYYQLKVPEASINEVINQEIEVVAEDNNTYKFEVVLLNKDRADVYVDFLNGNITNSGSNDQVIVKPVKISGLYFLDEDVIKYTQGIDGDENGAILTQNSVGAYTNINGFNFGTNDFTISTWINVPVGSTLSSGNSSYIFGTSNVDDCNDGFRVTVRQEADGKFYYNIRTSDSDIATKVIDPNMSYGEWHNVVLVRQKDRVHLYVDGRVITSLTIAEDTNFTSNVLNFGAYVGESWSYHPGKIAYDNIAVYDGAIDSKGIELIYNNKI
ncbi:MAG: hypothetical protein E7177_04130 [Erysipelotrichaceae bacterium]|nr:hypothetical protein [Erysipelotrichaceae bacterium]